MDTGRQRARTFHDLLVWQKAHQYVLTVYKLTATFPKRGASGTRILR